MLREARRASSSLTVAISSLAALVVLLTACAPPAASDTAGGVVAIVNASVGTDLYLGQFCGGVIISENAVATATHCVSAEDGSTVKVAAGVRDLCDEQERGREVVAVASAEVVPGTGGTVTLLHLTTPLLRTLALGQSGAGPIEALGWGRQSFAGVTRCDLRSVPLTSTNPERCAGLEPNIPPGVFICTLPSDATNTCDGDSGGPVYIYDGEGSLAQLAMTMSGFGCGPSSPGLNVLLDLMLLRSMASKPLT